MNKFLINYQTIFLFQIRIRINNNIKLNNIKTQIIKKNRKIEIIKIKTIDNIKTKINIIIIKINNIITINFKQNIMIINLIIMEKLKTKIQM